MTWKVIYHAHIENSNSFIVSRLKNVAALLLFMIFDKLTGQFENDTRKADFPKPSSRAERTLFMQEDRILQQHEPRNGDRTSQCSEIFPYT